MKKSSEASSLIPFGEEAHLPGQIPIAPESSISSASEAGSQEQKGQSAPDSSQSISENNGRKIPLDHLINRLNFINFQENRIQLHFVHRTSDHNLSIPAFPLPCSGPVLDCVWSAEPSGTGLRQDYDLRCILVPHGDKLIQSIPEVIEINTSSCRLALPSTSREISHRRIERQHCQGISVHLIQNGFTFSGSLLDFTASSFRVELRLEPAQDFDGIDTVLPVHVIFHSGKQTIYSSECRIIRTIRTMSERTSRSYVLEPLKQEAQRYRKAEFRSERQILNPSPNIIFRHPLTQRRVELKAVDISGSGFSVEEEENASVLMPGLILPEIELSFGNIFKLKCSVQVVFRKPLAGHEVRQRVRCGLALIDVTAQDHIKLLGLLHQVKNKNAYVCNDIDLDALWDFFFETGFIYPAKYALIEKNKKAIKATYAKLYTRSPDVARYFVYQDNGVILGHMAMIRFWQNTWLIHHHAARKSAAKQAGVGVLRQISHFTHDTFRVRSLHMDYLACYYRPQNKFPQRVFGGFAQCMKDPKACSIDSFAYLRAPGIGDEGGSLPNGWQLLPATDPCLQALSDFYDRVSGGLMLKAFDLEPSSWRNEALEQEYKDLGFNRKRNICALMQQGRLKALMIANVSDLGLNLSDLTRCIHAIVLDREDLTGAIFTASVQLAARSAGLEDVVALVYPEAYAHENSIPVDKTYHLWTFHVESAGQAYLRYLSRLTRHL
jgi:hypothetical protein